MAKYVIDRGDELEIKELRNKCRLVKDRIAKLGMDLLPNNHMPDLKTNTADTAELPIGSIFDYSIILEKEKTHDATSNMPNRVFRIWSAANTK